MQGLVSDVPEVMFGWSTGNALFRGLTLHDFIMEFGGSDWAVVHSWLIRDL